MTEHPVRNDEKMMRRKPMPARGNFTLPPNLHFVLLLPVSQIEIYPLN